MPTYDLLGSEVVGLDCEQDALTPSDAGPTEQESEPNYERECQANDVEIASRRRARWPVKQVIPQSA